MKIGIIGHSGHGQTALAESVLKTLEEKTGEKVQVVELPSEERGVFIIKPSINEPDPIIYRMVERTKVLPMPKVKGHQRPYKFHR